MTAIVLRLHLMISADPARTTVFGVAITLLNTTRT